MNHTPFQGKGDGIAVEKSGLNDNWDDAEGYYGMCLTTNISILYCIMSVSIYLYKSMILFFLFFDLVKYPLPGKRCALVT